MSECGNEKANDTVLLPYNPDKEYFIEPIQNLPSRPIYNFTKRVFDIVASSIGLVVLSIPMCIIAIAVKSSSEGPAFYSQDRLGYNGKRTRITKFRTMVIDAEKDCIRWSMENDPRVTPLGVILRKYHIDELPQLWDILRGDMSFVGPRPERECYYNAFESYIHGFRERLKVKPGLTGLAQIKGGSQMPPEEKIVWDVEYIRTRTFILDLKIIIQTLWPFRGRNNEST